MKKIYLLMLISLSFNVHAGDKDDILFRCFGTEPFWSAEVSAGSVHMKMMSEDLYKFDYSGIINAGGVTEDFIKIFRLENDSVKSAYLIIKKNEACKCSDGMSDNKYEYEAYLVIDNSAYYGCAVKK